MKFGDRFDLYRWGSANRRYWQHLHELGFKTKDPIYRYFAGEVFHDGEIGVVKWNVAERRIVLKLRNVHAINWLNARDTSVRFRINRKDFRTLVTFRDVDRVSSTDAHSGGKKQYHLAELSRNNGRLQIEIAFVSGAKHGHLKIICGSAEVEDILAKVRKYIPDGINPSGFLTWVNRNPIAYIDRYPAAS